MATPARRPVAASRPDGPRWPTFLRERAPLPPLLAVAFAQSLSAQVLVLGVAVPLRALAAALPLVALLVLMRLMDEVKDFAKDTVAHPERPLPRGLIGLDDAKRAIRLVLSALIGLALGIGVTVGLVPGLLYALCVAWVWLMYREFFAPRVLGANAYVYALTHQVIVLPMYFFAAAMASPEQAFVPAVVLFAIGGLGASFCYEVARKLDPAAAPILGTYRTRHGTPAAALVILLGIAVAAASARPIGIHAIVWPAAALTLALLPISLRDAKRHRWVEGAAALLVFAQMAAPVLIHWLGGRP